MKKIISITLVLVLIVSMGSFTFAKPAAGWDRWSDDAFEEYEGFIPPGLQGKGLPPGLAKQDNKIPNGWNKGDKPQFEERNQWREQNREIEDLEQLVTKVDNYLEDLEDNHGDFYDKYDDETEIIDELNDLLVDINEYLENIEDIDDPSEEEMDQLNEYYNALEDKFEELKELVKEELGENKAKLEEVKEVLEYIITTLDDEDDDDLIVDLENIIKDIDKLLEGFVTISDYKGILEDVDDDINNFDDLLLAYIASIEEDIEDFMYNYDSDALDDVEDQIDGFYDDENDFDVAEDDADEAYMDLYWLVKDLEADYDKFMAYKDELEEIYDALDDAVVDEDDDDDVEDLMETIKDTSEETGLVYEARVTEKEFLDLLEDADEFIDHEYSLVTDIEALIEDIEAFIADDDHDFVEEPDATDEFDLELKEDLEAKITAIENIIDLDGDEDLSDEYAKLDTEFEALQELFADLMNSEG